MRMNVFIDGGGDVSDNTDKVIEILTAGHDTDKIRIIRKIDNTTVVELFLVGVEILSFPKFVGNSNVLRNTGDNTLDEFGLA
jgi:hypothetical protein